MRGDTASLGRRPSATDVIAFLQADYRLRCGIDPEVDEGHTLNEATTILDWRATCDLVPVSRLANSMNTWFGTALPWSTWQRTLEPESEQTLGDLAAVVAANARWNDFAPLAVAGKPDVAVGAFFFLRGELARVGVRVEGLRPSSPINSFLRPPFDPLGRVIARSAPSVMPEPQYEPSRRHQWGAGLIVLGCIGLVLCFAWPRAWNAFCSLVIAGLGVWLGRGDVPLSFGAFRTFGDVARAMAKARDAA